MIACPQVRSIMAEGGAKSKIKSSEFRFKPVKGWLGGNSTEKVGGWKTRVFEVSAPRPYVLRFQSLQLLSPESFTISKGFCSCLA